MGLTAGEVEYILKLRDDLSQQFAQTAQNVQTQSTAVSNSVKEVSDNSNKASLSVYQLRSALRDTFEGNFQGAVENLAASIGADLEGSIALSSTAMVAGGIAAAGMAGAMGYLVERSVAAGEANQDFAYKTTVATEAVEPLKEAITIAGGSLDQFGNLLFRMQQQMTQHPDQFEHGLENIHLTMRDIQGLTMDETLLKIATAFRENTDQTNRSLTAVELFTRMGRDAIPTLMKPLADLVEQSRLAGHVMGTEDTKAAEDLGMSYRGLKEQLGWSTTETGFGFIHFWYGLADAINEADVRLGRFSADANDPGGKAALARLLGDMPTPSNLPQHGATEGGGTATLQYLKSLADYTRGVTYSDLDLKEAEKALTKADEEHLAALKKNAEALAEYQSLGTSYADLLDRIGNSTYEGIAYDHQRGATVEQLAQVYQVTTAEVRQVLKLEADALKSLDAEWKDVEESRAIGVKGMEAVDKSFAGGQNVLQNLSVTMGNTTIGGKQLAQQLGVITNNSDTAKLHIAELTHTIGSDLADAMESIPGIIQQAFTGGGGLSGALNGIGSMIGSTIGKSVASNLQATLEVGSGQALGALGKTLLAGIPVVGSLLGPAISGLIGLFHHGPSEAEIAAQKAWTSELQKTVSAFDQLASEGAKAEALRNGNADWAKSNAIVTEAYVAMGKTGSQALADLTEAVNGEGSAQQVAIDKINEAIGLYQEVDAAARKYGFDTSTTAKTLINDWTGLVNKGFDVSTVTKQMSSDIMQYLKDAQKVGAQVPPEMEPLLEKLSTIGDITDENAQKQLMWGLAASGASADVLKAYQDYIDGIIAANNKAQGAQSSGGGGGGNAGVSGGGAAGSNYSGGYIWLIQRQDPGSIVAVSESFIGTSAQLDSMKAKFEAKGGHLTAEYWAASGALPAPLTALPMAAGGTGTVDRPTLFLAGETGQPEQYAFSGAGKTFSSGKDDTYDLGKQLAALNRRLPTILALAVRDAIVKARAS